MLLGFRVIFYIFYVSFLLAYENTIVFSYENALDAYRKGQYDLSIQEFESILSQNWESPELYYNLGNSYYRLDKISGAIWGYENCLKLLPTHSKAKYNLKLSNLKVIDRVEMPNPPIYLKWYLFIVERFSPAKWVQYSLIFLLFYAILIVFKRMIPLLIFSKLKVVLIFFLICLLFLTIHSIWIDNSFDLGIIYSSEVEAMSEPNEYSTQLFKVHEGLKVSVKNVNNDWIEIELLDQKTGWIKSNNIRLIN